MSGFVRLVPRQTQTWANMKRMKRGMRPKRTQRARGMKARPTVAESDEPGQTGTEEGSPPSWVLIGAHKGASSSRPPNAGRERLLRKPPARVKADSYHLAVIGSHRMVAPWEPPR